MRFRAVILKTVLKRIFYRLLQTILLCLSGVLILKKVLKGKKQQGENQSACPVAFY